MSPIRPPTRTAETPATRARQVSVTSSLHGRGRPRPTTAVRAASPKYPSTIAPRSRPTMSPSRSFRFGVGIPWTTSSFTEEQIVFG